MDTASSRSIGGAALQLATMHRLLVQKENVGFPKSVFSRAQLLHRAARAGTQQLRSMSDGWCIARIGGIIAGGQFILPGAVCMMALSFGYVTGAIADRPGLIPRHQARHLGRNGEAIALRPPRDSQQRMAALAGAAFAAAFFKVAFPIIRSGRGIARCLCRIGRPARARQSVAAAMDGSNAAHQHEELSDHTRPSLTQFVRSLTFWPVLWLTPPIALLANFGINIASRRYHSCSAKSP